MLDALKQPAPGSEPVWRFTPLIDLPGDYPTGSYRFEWEREWRLPGSLHMTTKGLRVKARVQHPQVKPRKDREGCPWVFRYWADEIQSDGSIKTLRKYHAVGPSKGNYILG